MSVEEGLFAEAHRMLESALTELEEYLKDRDPVHMRQASEKGWSTIVLVTDYMFARLGIIRYIKSITPEGRGLYTHERRVLLDELKRRVEAVKEKRLRERFGFFGYDLHAWGFYEGAIDLEGLRDRLHEVKEYMDDIGETLPELEKRKEELFHALKEKLEVRIKIEEELRKLREELARKYYPK